MTEQMSVDAGSDAGRGQVTSYVVMVARGDDSPMVWVEAGVLDVPARTTRVTVASQAKDMVSTAVGDMREGSTVRFRIYPLDQQTEATATLERPAPQLQVTIP